ncbi:MAG: galactose-1-phosphate uridylyltransferase [Candidatus Bathyarchaeota archaeon]|nr:galactose-1-phosphate uridylyltransferase [Candidatus Bathyarchaeota archaeon]
MAHNELRKDYLLNRWVVIATERARRPTDFAKNKTEQPKTVNCPLCPGNEHVTPPAMLVYLPSEGGIRKDKEQGDFRSKNWLLRNIPNLYPAFSPPKDADDSKIMKSRNFGYAVGHHEVLVESPNHTDHPANMELGQLVLVVNAYKDRLRDLSQKPYVRYVQIFRNHGLEAGASLSHAHSQIVATPFIPPVVSDEMEASRNYHKEHGRCFFCDLIKQEAQTPRLILDGGHFTVFAPYASVHPLEFWIVPKRHTPNFLSLTKEETEAFAQTLKTTLKALKDLVNDPPYNFGIHLAINKDAQDSYHWHLEVYPKLAIWAGFEKSTGIYINTVTPETAAQELKKTIQQTPTD